MSFQALFDFESALAEYTGAPYAVVTDGCTHAIELCMRYENIKECQFSAYTYLSVPMALKHLNIDYKMLDETWIGEYHFKNTRIWDSARRLEPNMYRPGQFQCLSFGWTKPLQLGKVGAILLDDAKAYQKFSRQRADGRDLHIPWQNETELILGYHYCPTLELCVRGLEMLPTVEPKSQPGIYPDLRNIFHLPLDKDLNNCYNSSKTGHPRPQQITRRKAMPKYTSPEEQKIENLRSSKIVEEAPYHPGYEDAAMGPMAFDEDKDYTEANLADAIRFQMKRDKKRFWAGDNISDYLHKGDKERLINEATAAFEKVLDTLLIDRENDPNSKGTARRLAKMYFTEIMGGRYDPAPDATAFPNDSADRYEGMLVVRSELRSMCSHHHQPVSGVAYIGIIAANKLIGLSKYTRIAQWCARRGTLQEELCNDIAREIMRATDSENVGVYIQATHGCCENRGIMAHSSLTQTTVLKGSFQTDPGTKKEFMDNIKLQQDFAPR